MSEFEAMVERACVQLHGRNWPAMGDALQAQLREEMRPVLTEAGVPELLAEVERLNGELTALRADAESLRRCLRHAETELAALGGGGNG